MMKPILLAAFLATGLSAGAAEAASVQTTARVETGTVTTVQFQPPHHRPGWHRPGPRRVCTPVYKTVRVHGRNGWFTKRVVVSHRCHWVRGYRW